MPEEFLESKKPHQKIETSEEKTDFDFLKLLREQIISQIRNLIKEPKDLTDFEKWRELDKEGREARRLRKITEILTAVKAILEKQPEKRERITREILKLLNFKENIASWPRTEQFFAFLTAEVLGLEKPKVRGEVERLMSGLKKVQSTEGELNALELLTSSQIGLGFKREWIEAQFLHRLSFLLRRDLEEAKIITPPSPQEISKGEIPPISELPPEIHDFLKPSIEEMTRREGEPTGYFTVIPFYGGYWKEEIFDEWNPQNFCFRKSLRKIKEAKEVKVEERTERVMSGRLRGKTRMPLPCAYNFAFLPRTLKSPKGQKIKILEDEKGNYILESQEEEIVYFTVSLAKRKEPQQIEETPRILEIETGRLSDETEKFLEDLKNENIPSLEKARRLKHYVRRILEYPQKGDSSYNVIYKERPEKFFQRIERFKKADCDVANAFFIALLSRLGIPCRMVVGHYIKTKDHQGRAVFSSSTKHAWTEVWDNGWHRLDATPAGAPELDQEETDEKQNDEDFEGDFGEIEGEILSDREIEKIIEEVKKIQEEQKEKEKSVEEITALNFAKEAGCSSEEARQILKEIEQARELKDSKGRKILDILLKEFMKIIKENFREFPSYRAPVRLPEADELEEPVEAYIDIKTGQIEPSGFKKYERKTEKVQEYGGFDVIFVKDKSGSMMETDPHAGKVKYKEQQLANFLLNEALHRFSDYAKTHRIYLLSPLDIRFSDIGFQEGKAEVFLPLTDKWGPREQFIVWKKSAENIGGGTPDNLGLKAARQMIEQDIKERKKDEKRLRIVIVLTDGGTDPDKVKDRENEKKLLQKMDVIVVGLGLTETAKAVKAAYYPNGDYVKSISEIPEWIAQRIIEQVKKLYPKKIKK